MRKYFIGIVAALALIASPAAADWTGKNAAGTTITFKNAVDCTSGTCIPIAALTDATGATLYGTAGTANANILTVQGIASMTPFLVTLGAETSKVIGTVRAASGGFASGAMVDLGAQADSAAAADNSTASLIALLKRTNQNLTTLNTSVNGAIPAGTATIGTVGQLPYPVGATPITASNTGTTGATTATLAGTSGKTTYICGYSIRANATAATTVTNTITGVITATLSSIMWVAPLASGIGVDEQIFSPCVPASATNQAIAVVSGAPGSGGTVSSRGWGYQL